jgi:hypothetical protein
MKNIPFDIIQDIEKLHSIIRGCDEALSANLENWERKEYLAARAAAVSDLEQRETGIKNLFAFEK